MMHLIIGYATQKDEYVLKVINLYNVYVKLLINNFKKHIRVQSKLAMRKMRL